MQRGKKLTSEYGKVASTTYEYG